MPTANPQLPKAQHITTPGPAPASHHPLIPRTNGTILSIRSLQPAAAATIPVLQGDCATPIEGAFAAGDAPGDALFIVWPIGEGSGAAHRIDEHFIGTSHLPTPGITTPFISSAG